MATNRVHIEGRKLGLAVASTVVSGDPVLVGSMGGIALTNYSSRDGEATIDFGGVYDLSVKGVGAGGNEAVAVGDPLYFTAGDTPKINKKTTGTFFGYALETVGSNATATIAVRCMGGAGGANASGYYASGISISDEITGNGSAQNYAHGLGVAPAKVVVALTEFASNVNVDVAEGSHTSTNAIVTVTTGVKYKVMAFRP